MGKEETFQKQVGRQQNRTSQEKFQFCTGKPADSDPSMDKEAKKDGRKFAIATTQRVEEKGSLRGAPTPMRNNRYG